MPTILQVRRQLPISTHETPTRPDRKPRLRAGCRAQFSDASISPTRCVSTEQADVLSTTLLEMSPTTVDEEAFPEVLYSYMPKKRHALGAAWRLTS